MRRSLALGLILSVASLSVAQPEITPIPSRYGVPAASEAYPQNSAKETLASAVRAVERNKFDYLAAHLLDPKFIDDRVADRAKPLEGTVDLELRAVRENQRKNPALVAPEYRLPDDPRVFDLVVRGESRSRAFQLVVREIRDTISEHSDYVNDFKKFLREGQFVDSGEGASASVKAIKERQLFFRRIETRWFVENRQTPDATEKK